MKQKIIGLCFATFFYFWLFLWFKPKKGIDAAIFKANSIDSIIITKSQRDFVITSPGDISSIATLLTQAPKVTNMDRENINKGFYDLNFYFREIRKPLEIRVLFNFYHGIVISGNDFYYVGDSLNEKVESIIGK